jgi:hypothetical protein
MVRRYKRKHNIRSLSDYTNVFQHHASKQAWKSFWDVGAWTLDTATWTNAGTSVILGDIKVNSMLAADQTNSEVPHGWNDFALDYLNYQVDKTDVIILLRRRIGSANYGFLPSKLYFWAWIPPAGASGDKPPWAASVATDTSGDISRAKQITDMKNDQYCVWTSIGPGGDSVVGVSGGTGGQKDNYYVIAGVRNPGWHGRLKLDSSKYDLDRANVKNVTKDDETLQAEITSGTATAAAPATSKYIVFGAFWEVPSFCTSAASSSAIQFKIARKYGVHFWNREEDHYKL